MQTLNVPDVLENWAAERKLLPGELAFLETAYDQTVEAIATGCSFEIAGNILCSSLDMPKAVYTCQLVAGLLDFVKPLPNEPKHARLVELTEALVDCGQLEPEVAEALFEDL